MMMDQSGILLIRRINWFDKNQWPDVREKQPSVNLSHLDILRQYRGFEGELWPNNSDVFFNLQDTAVASLEIAEVVYSYSLDISSNNQREIYDCISVITPTLGIENNPCFLGFEVGYFDVYRNVFSGVFNDVIYGHYKQLNEIADILNNNLLFPSQELAISFINKRNDLIACGADLESDEPLVCRAILSPISGAEHAR